MTTLYGTNELACPICGGTMRFCGYLEVPYPAWFNSEVFLWFCSNCWETWNPIALNFYQEFLQEQQQDWREAERLAGQLALPGFEAAV